MSASNNRLSQPITLHRQTPKQARHCGPTFLRGKQQQSLKRKR